MGDDVATCVAVDVRPTLARTLLRLVEGALGWQVVAADDAVLPARCQLVDVAAAIAAGPRHLLPRILVVAADDPARDIAAAARRVVAVVGPDPHADELRAAVAALDETGPATRPWILLGASAGGVGATTVAAALAGLRAWEQGPTLLVAAGPAHVPAAPVVRGEDLATPAVWEAAAPAVALPELRAVGWRPGGAGPPPLARNGAVLEFGIHEAGVQPLDVLVVRPDRAGLDAVASAVGSPAIVVVGAGPVAIGALRAAATGPVARVPWSARVASATAAGRLPAGLPGRWLAALRPVYAARSVELVRVPA